MMFGTVRGVSDVDDVMVFVVAMTLQQNSSFEDHGGGGWGGERERERRPLPLGEKEGG